MKCSKCDSGINESEQYKILKGKDKGKILCWQCFDEWKEVQLEGYFTDINNI